MESPALEPLFSAAIIAQRVQELSRRISCDFAGRRPVIIGVLKGAFVFLSDLARHLTIDADIDFVQVSSYGSSLVSSGCCTLKKDMSMQVAGRDVLIVDDIFDSGQTAAYLLGHVQQRGPKSVRLCCLIERQVGRQHTLNLDYAAFSIQDGFVVGYGLDFEEQFRGLPEIYTLRVA